MYFDTEGKSSVGRSSIPQILPAVEVSSCGLRMAEIIESKWSDRGFEMAEIKERILANILIVKPETNAQLMQHLQVDCL